MGLDKFEKQIKNHQEFFEQEPSMEHMDKFLFQLQEKKATVKTLSNNFKWWMSIAASIVVLIGFGWFIQNQNISTQTQNNLSAELFEIKNYYNMESEKKLVAINECAQGSQKEEKLLKNTEIQLQKIDFNTQKLEHKLKNAQGNKQIELAYVKSLKAKNDIINTMYNEMCQAHQPQLLTQ
ncbi:MAG: hypothetical protein B7C24_04775 [Bacteroidetes bacterium 4572_77]|nr:MAG: hypothetical protein B7C24_04775 [Bacteroidetes bacterium 4572_77]